MSHCICCDRMYATIRGLCVNPDVQNLVNKVFESTDSCEIYEQEVPHRVLRQGRQGREGRRVQRFTVENQSLE